MNRCSGMVSGVLCLLLTSTFAFAVDAAPRTDAEVMAKVSFAPSLNAKLPVLELTGDDGPIALPSLLARGPSLVTFAWFECANLCGLILNGLADSSSRLPDNMAADFQVLVVSMDPAASRTQARNLRHQLAQQYPAAGIAGRWHFLTGEAEAINRLARALGYGFSYDQRKQQFAHPAGVVAISRDGHIRDFRSGVNYRTEDVEHLLSAAGAAEPAAARPNPVLLLCYDNDPSSGRYSLAIMKLLRLLAVVMLVVFAGAVIYWQRRAGNAKAGNEKPGNKRTGGRYGR